MFRMRNLNGWQRLWVVFAGATLVYALAWGFSEVSTYGGERVNEKVIAGFANPACRSILEMGRLDMIVEAANEAANKKSPCSELLYYRSYRSDYQQEYGNAPTTANDYVKDIEARRREYFLGALGIPMGIWLVGVLLLYAVGLLVAWVRRGFAPSREHL